MILFRKQVLRLAKKDFPELLSEYLTSYLPNYKNVSKYTISSYCDTFRLFLKYCRDCKNISTEKLSFNRIDVSLINEFLQYLEDERGSSITTRNQRYMALRSFFKYVQAETPEYYLNFQKILNIPIKKSAKKSINYLTKSEIQILFNQPDTATVNGRRDLTLLCLMYDTGARVQEIIDLTPQDIRLDAPEFVRLTGKGRKTRDVPILKNTANNLKNYLSEHNLLELHKKCYPVFVNQKGDKITRFGVTYILDKYCKAAQEKHPSFPDNVTPHILRHTKAMHLLQAGVDLIYIRDILGHVSVATTQIYARADMTLKRRALETLGETNTPNIPIWLENQDLLSWLKSLGKKS